MRRTSKALVLVLLCVPLAVLVLRLTIAAATEPGTQPGRGEQEPSTTQTGSLQSIRSDIVNEAWRTIIGDPFKTIVSDPATGKITILSDMDIRTAQETDLHKWALLAEENGDAYAISQFETITNAMSELSGAGKPVTVFNLDDEGYLVSVVPVDQWLMPQGLTEIAFVSPKADHDFYLYDKIWKQKEEAEIYLQEGESDEAIRTFTDWLGTGPDFAVSHFYVGDIYLYENDFSKANSHYEVGSAYNPDNARAVYNWGYTNLRMESFEKARDIFETYVAVEPNDVEAQCALLKIYQHFGNREAIKTQERLIRKLDPSYLKQDKEIKPRLWFQAILART